MLTGKIALVTGASRGVGRAIALRLAEDGADVIINYLRKKSAAQEVAAAVEALGRRALVVKANVSEEEGIGQLIAAAQEFGGLDIVISNAASGVMEPMLDVTYKHWQHTMNTNAFAFLSLVQQATPLLEARGGGRVIALSSTGATRVTAGYSLVGTSKAALESLVRYCGVELAPKGILVNAVSPGLIDTDAAHFLPNADELLAYTAQKTPAGRMVTVEDVAELVSFLCSPRARMIVGQTIVMDGGFGLTYH